MFFCDALSRSDFLRAYKGPSYLVLGRKTRLGTFGVNLAGCGVSLLCNPNAFVKACRIYVLTFFIAVCGTPLPSPLPQAVCTVSRLYWGQSCNIGTQRRTYEALLSLGQPQPVETDERLPGETRCKHRKMQGTVPPVTAFQSQFAALQTSVATNSDTT